MSLPPPLPLDTEGSRMMVPLAIAFPAVATVSLIGRFIARSVKHVRPGLDDYIMIPGLFAVYAQCIIVIFSTIYGGIGHHISDLKPDNLVTLYKLLAGVQFTFGTSLGLAKISLCLLLIKIFPAPRFRIAAYIVLGYCICWVLMVYSIGAGLCRPFAFNWDKMIPNGRCGNLNAAYVSIAVFDILGDLMIIALPMYQVWHLHARTTVKVGLSIMFALGLLNIVVAILRIVYLLRIDFSPTSDVSWDATTAYAWSVVEPALGYIVANGAVFSPAIHRGVQFVADGWTKLISTSVIQKVRPGLSAGNATSRSGHVQVGSTEQVNVSRSGAAYSTHAKIDSMDEMNLPPYGISNVSNSGHIEADRIEEPNLPRFGIHRKITAEVSSSPK